MTKREIDELFSKIEWGGENPSDYEVVYREFDEYVIVSYHQWKKLQKEFAIPQHRISQIRKNGIAIYTRPFFCKECGNPLIDGVCSNKYCKLSVRHKRK